MSARRVCSFEVDGVPVQQGSKSGFVRTSAAGKSHVNMTDQNEKSLKPWRQNVAWSARAAHQGDRMEGPVLLVVEFRFVRPRTIKRELPSVKPDVDKLLRALMDGITDSGIWRDDAQVVAVHMKKVYADRAGAHVEIGEYSTPNPKRTKEKQ